MKNFALICLFFVFHVQATPIQLDPMTMDFKHVKVQDLRLYGEQGLEFTAELDYRCKKTSIKMAERSLNQRLERVIPIKILGQDCSKLEAKKKFAFRTKDFSQYLSKDIKKRKGTFKVFINDAVEPFEYHLK